MSKFKEVWDPAIITVPVQAIKGCCTPQEYLDMKLNYNLYLSILNRLCLNYVDKQEFVQLIIDYYQVSRSKVLRDISNMDKKGYLKTNNQKVWMNKKGLMACKSAKKIMIMNKNKKKNSFSNVEMPREIDMKKSRCLIDAKRKGYSVMLLYDGSQDHWKEYRKNRLYICVDSIINEKVHLKAIYLDIYNNSKDKRKSIKMLDDILRKFFENEVNLRKNIDTEVHLLYYTNTQVNYIRDNINKKVYEEWIENNLENKRELNTFGPEVLRDVYLKFEVILCDISKKQKSLE